jgi:hypothetical protein
MSNVVWSEDRGHVAGPSGDVRLVSRAELARSRRWANAFAGKRKDHRFYELVEDTLSEGFEYRYFAICDAHGEVTAIQPFFILDQDIVLGAGPAISRVVGTIRRLWPRCLMLRTLMVGCVAGEGHLDGAPGSAEANARRLAAGIVAQARRLRAPLIVLKEFPKQYRNALNCFLEHGFTRTPSLPMTRLNIDYANFEDYMTRALNSATRRKLRKKFKIAALAAPIEMSVVDDATAVVDEIYPLYLQVYERSKLHFEKLTKDFLCGVGRLMPDRARFFIWRQEGKIVAFSLCLVEGEALYAEYIGLDYSVALDLHLYHYIVRDMTAWAIANGYKWFRSSGLNYDPKLHLRHQLDPIDLYVRHASPAANAVLRRILPWIEPTRNDPILKMFANYDELWDET